ncbi:peroxisomal leader peptide-processing protease [Gadus morhua]|uniref:Peroxisomal leader peptide-processing protease n=1 Tax=Gadus morhua TaxID=8049 RepID=A0A8C5ATV0_GADMO|nr:peroxisomal leader peptide-processing protease [Gadus morhua]
MDLIEGSCCVVTVSQPASEQRGFSCSGVILNHHAGIIICNGFPFSRFMNHKSPVDLHSRFLLPDTFTANLDILIHSPARKKVKKDLIPNINSAPHKAKVLMLVNCLEFNMAFHTIFQESDSWKFHNDDGMEELIKESRFLSWFAVLKTDFEDSCRSSINIPYAKSSSLRKGSAVVACGSPFGSLCPDLFTNTLSTGIVSNLCGEDNAVILTDARCLPGTEGGGLFVMESDDHASLVGVIVSSLCWKGVEWIGLTLVCSVQVILRNIRDITDRRNVESTLTALSCLHGSAPEGLRGLSTASSSFSSSKLRKYPTVCLIESGQFWGSGVLVASRLALTCRHVVNGKKTVTLKFHHKGRFHVVMGDVLFSTKPSSSYDFAVVQLRDSAPEVVVPPVAKSFQPGEEVVVVGYGGLGKSCGPSLTGGILSKAVNWDRTPVMLQTTCAVQAGASGGAVVRKHSGELLGIVASNTRDCTANVTYPHLNYSIPATVFQPLLERFSQSGNTEAFRELDASDAGVRRVWRLQNAQSKL